MFETINDVPKQGRYLILKLISEGAIEVNDGKINLSKSVYEVLIILAKKGIL